MKWLRDVTGRFPQRPYYEQDELDHECEAIVTAFLKAKHGSIAYPIPTEDLVRLIQRETADLDLYADFPDAGIEGQTDFIPGQKPRVRIAHALSEQSWRENRLRTTLTHEYGHVRFHDLWPANQMALPLFEGPSPIQCKRDLILDAGAVDWLEWQAGYASGAFLMPITVVKQIVGDIREEFHLYGAIPLNSRAGEKLILQLQRAFQVSEDAARVRLRQLGCLGTSPTPPTLF
jgi:hypothetical protein